MSYPPEDPHGYTEGTIRAAIFAAGVCAGGFLSILTFAIATGGTHV